MVNILSGKEVALALKTALAEEVKALKDKGMTLGLCILMVGDSPDSASYTKGAVKRCEDIGINCDVKILPESVTQEGFIQVVRELNNNDSVHGILIMRPLPKHISEDVIKYEISPAKDVDCFSPVNVSKVISGDKDGFAPCTPSAVIEMLNHYGIKAEGKRTVVVGRSMVVGRPLSMMLLHQNATVTICHTRTADLADETRRAEILVAAAGKAKMITRDMVSPGTVVIDVGINFENGKMCGDVDYDEVAPIAGMITPVPGGVGAVTTTVLAKHVVKAFKLQKHL